MNLKTTLTLVALVLAGGVLWLGVLFLGSRPPASATLSILETQLKPDKIDHIVVERGERKLDLKRTGASWSLPGNWPTRAPEVQQLVELLTGLRSRFAAIPVNDSQLADFGLERPAVTVTVHAGDSDYRLQFGEETQGEANRFSRPTYLRIDDKKEIVRLAPGIVGMLDRHPDYYQQRRLFPFERLKQADSPDKNERLAARSIAVQGKTGAYTLQRTGTEPQAIWELSAPVVDRADPDKVKSLLGAVPDVWAEQFVDGPKKELDDYGLKEPEQTLTVTPPEGAPLVLQIGKQSQMKTRTVTRPPPFSQPGMPPRPPTTETIHEEYRFAKLKDNDQVFEIKADKLKDLFVAADTLRDPRLARFRSAEAREVVISRDGQEIVLAKENERWKLQKPFKKDAEDSKVTELLDKLSGLEAKEKDVIDKGDAKTYGFEPPAGTIQVTVEESLGEGEAKTKTKKTYVFTIGKRDEEKKKLYVRVDKWERINAVEDSLNKLVDRPALAYRGRRVLDFATSDLAKLEVQSGAKKFELKQEKDVWRLTAPEPADADSSKVGQLVADLARLEAVEYVSDEPKPDDLDKLYGLASPALSATVTFSKTDKEAQKLLIGKQRGDKDEFFAKLAAEPAVFVVKKEIRTALEQGSLAFLPLQLWQLKPEEIGGLRLQKGEQEFSLNRDGKNWRIAGPFEANAMADAVKPMIDELATLKTERYEAVAAKELGTYGLDKPYLRLVVTPAAKKEADDKDKEKDPEKNKDDKKTKERVLLIGKPTAAGAKSRFAKLGDGEAIFVIGEKLLAAVDRNPLDLLERNLLSLNPKEVTSIKSAGTGGALTLERKGETWDLEAPSAKFVADREAVASLLGVWSNLRAERFAAYGPKVDPAEFSLDKPMATVTVILKKPADDDKEPAKDETHVLVIGKTVDKDAKERFARLDNGPGIFVLTAPMVAELTRTHLDFVDRALLKLDASAVTGLSRKLGNAELEIVKKDDGWHLVKPTAQRADGPTLEALFKDLSSLRAERVAAYQPKDLKPFGLDAPSAVVTLQLGEDKKAQHVLKIGGVVAATEKAAGKPASGGRYVLVDDSVVVGVIPEALAKRLRASSLHFRDRLVARLKDEIDRATLQRGTRTAVFTKVEGTWKMTKPIAADADQTDLEDFINALSRLRADDLVAEKPEDDHGLERPLVRWRFQLGDKDVLTLLVGSVASGDEAAGGPRRYAKLGSGDLVFLLTPKMTGQALGEYRSRNVWPALDAAQVETLRYNYERNPYVLEKKDNTWTVAGKPEAKLIPEVVSATLDALSRLRAERYVADTDADLKLYGLEPPLLALEIQTGSGKRLLHIGRPEGESKRYYARVAEDKRTDVFLIGEADATRIVRELKDFIKSEAKPAAPKPAP